MLYAGTAHAGELYNLELDPQEERPIQDDLRKTSLASSFGAWAQSVMCERAGVAKANGRPFSGTESINGIACRTLP